MANLSIGEGDLPPNVRAVVCDILEAFDCACELRELTIAKRLLDTIEAILTKRRVPGIAASDRNQPEGVSMAYERLRQLQQAASAPL